MTYELAKELKEVGFPQKGGGKMMYKPYLNQIDTSTLEGIYYPTLSELIEACGEDFIMLGRADDGKHYFATGRGEPMFPPLHEGSTADEAVATLWLAIHTPKPEQP